MASLIYFLYSLLLGMAMLLSLPYWLFQMLWHGKYRHGLLERLGEIPRRLAAEGRGSTQNFAARPQRVVWVHAVSVGEVLAISGLAEAMRSRFPHLRLVVSTTTDTGQILARKRFGEENVFYFPMDFAFAIQPYLRALRPELVVIAETEFWPNFLRLARSSGARVAVVNARISDRSQPNYRRFRWALSRALANVDLFLTQTAEDASRLQAIGASQERVQVVGNLKFDAYLPTPPAIVEHLRNSFAETKADAILVCGSTVDGEEAVLLQAFENILVAYPKAVMILAPRHPERFEEVATLLGKINIRYSRRSGWKGEPLSGSVFLVDAIGELASLYSLADLAFVGGSLVPRGGHNIIEPAQHGRAIVVGNHTENFRDIVSLFQSHDAVRIVSPTELSSVFLGLLAHPNERAALGRRALETVRSQTGATQRTLDALSSLLEDKDISPPVSSQPLSSASAAQLR